MSGLTDLTLRAALDGLAAGTFSSEELTRAHVEAVEAARPLNAYILETPDKALEMARASDARRAAGEAGPLEGAPLDQGPVLHRGCPHHRGQPHPRGLHPHLRVHGHIAALARRGRHAR